MEAKNEPNWEIVKTINIKHGSEIGGFNDESFGITVGYSGEVHYTNDGGNSWPRASNDSHCRFGFYIVNSKVAYNCGNAGHVRRTEDGGKTWTKVENFGDSDPNHCRHLSFINENIGWIAAPKKLGMTKDSGKAWTEIKLPNGIGDITAIDLLNEKDGYLMDKNNNLYATKDLGQTWDTKKVNIKNINRFIFNKSNSSYLKFLDEEKAVFFSYDMTSNLKCSYTYNGGDTWEEKIIPNIKGMGLYLSADGKFLSVNSNRTITLLQQK